MKQGVSSTASSKLDKDILVSNGFLTFDEDKYKLTPSAKAFCAKLDNYFIKATKMYVNEYRDADYMYMQTSQYFICKQDKHKVKSSTLADYCDMIRDGIDTEEKTFKEKVV